MEKNVAVDLRNKYFVGTRGFYGANSVKYQNVEMEVPSYEYDFSGTKNSFDWGDTDQGSTLLASAILKKISSPTVARVYANKFTQSVISNLKDDTWELEAIDVAKWINKNTEYKIDLAEVDEDEEAKKREEEAKEKRRIQREKEFQEEIQRKLKERSKKEKEAQKEKEKKEKENSLKKSESTKKKSSSPHNIVDKISQELDLTPKELAKILNIPQETINDWRLENEMPKMALKAVEFYKNAYEAKKELQEIKKSTDKQLNNVEKYKNETAKCKAEIIKLKAQKDKDRLEIEKHKNDISQKSEELQRYKKFINSIDIPALFEEFDS